MISFREFNDKVKQTLAPNVDVVHGKKSGKKHLNEDVMKYFKEWLELLKQPQYISNTQEYYYYTSYKLNLPKPYDDFKEFVIEAESFNTPAGVFSQSRSRMIIYTSKEIKKKYTKLSEIITLIQTQQTPELQELYITLYHEFIHYLQSYAEKYANLGNKWANAFKHILYYSGIVGLESLQFESARDEMEAYFKEYLYSVKTYLHQYPQNNNNKTIAKFGKHFFDNFNLNKKIFLDKLIYLIIESAYRSAESAGYGEEFKSFKPKLEKYLEDLLNAEWNNILKEWNANKHKFPKEVIAKIENVVS